MDAAGACGQFFPAAPLPNKDKARIPEAGAGPLEGVDEHLGGQPVRDGAGVDKDGSGAGGEALGHTTRHGLGHAHAVGDDDHALRPEVARTPGDPVGHGDDAAGAAQREGLQGSHRAHDRARHARERGGVGDDIRAVVDVGQAPQGARESHGRAGRGRRLADDYVGAGTGQQARDERQVEGQVGHVSAHCSRLVA